MTTMPRGQNNTKAIGTPVFDPNPTPTRRLQQTSKYSEAMATKICEQLMLQRSLKEIASEPNMPSMRTIVRWLADPAMVGFREMYYYARRVQAEIYIDEIFEIADDSSGDYKKVWNSKHEEYDIVPDNEHIQRSRVRIDTRKWFAAKMVPRIYGEKIEASLDVTGDLAELLKNASNRDNGLPSAID